MMLKIQRLSDMNDPKPGPGWVSIQNRKPIVRCACGTWFSLRLHQVAEDGTVTPSFHHLYKNGHSAPESGPGCGFHEYVKLEKYFGGIWEAEKSWA